MDMPFTQGSSVNDEIYKPLCSLSHITVMDGAGGVTLFDRGALMAKVDINFIVQNGLRQL